MKKWSKLINDTERVLLEPGRFVPKFESVRTQVWVGSYQSLSQVAPKPRIDSHLIFTLPTYSKHPLRERMNRC